MKDVEVFDDEGSVGRSIIHSFEKWVGVCFPKLYVSLLSKHNCLKPARDVFDFAGYDGEIDSRDVSFLGYQTEQYDGRNGLIEDYQEEGEFNPRGIVVIGDAANGDFICFDYRHDPKTCNPPVVLMIHDDFMEDQEGQPWRVIFDVAPSFEAFMDMLYSDEE